MFCAPSVPFGPDGGETHAPDGGSYTPPMTKALLAAALLSLGVCTASADAQLTPDRLYFGVDRPIPMTVAARGRGKAATSRSSSWSP